MDKVITLDDFKKKDLKKKYKKIVLAHGVFDVLHIGHLRYLNKAKILGDCLIVSVTNDKNVNKGINRPFFNENLRLEAISQLECVDYVLLSEESTSDKIIKTLKPDIYVKGNDYKKVSATQTLNYKTELRALKKVKGKFIIIDDINFSSSNLINSSFDKLNQDQRNLLKKLIVKKKFDFESLTKKKIKDPILVIGDIIIDRFVFTQSLGKSRKNNIISTRFKKTEIYDGGSLMVVKILADFFSNISFLTCLNSNELKLIKKKFKNINFINIPSKEKGMTTKSRYVDEYNLTKIFQINENDQINISKSNETIIIKKLKHLSQKFKKIVITDFGHGIISKKINNSINNLDIDKFINCQANSSNFGYNKFTKYNSAKILSCDEDEYRLSLGESSRELNKSINDNINKFKKFKKMIVTSGKQGSYSIEKKKVEFVKSLNIDNMIDSIGCGDVFFSYLIVLDQLKITKILTNSEMMILCHLAASLHSKYFANSKLINRIEFIRGLKSFSS